MLRAMIADDEYRVCQLIEQLGDWNKLGIKVVKVCSDGEEALEGIKEEKPDIVITDIRMPVYDGLELIRRTKELGIDTEFVVISGYRQFEYAYGAIQYGVSDYLLKPIDKNQLNAALAKICGKYDAKRAQQESGERLEQMQTERAVWGEEQFLSLLAGGGFQSKMIGEYRREYHIALTEGLVYQAIAINTNRAELHQPGGGFGEKAVETVKEQLSMASWLAALLRPQGILVVAAYEPDRHQAVTQAVSQTFSRIRALRDFYGDFDLAVALGKKAEGPEGLGETVAGAIRSEQAKLTAGWNRVIDPFLNDGPYTAASGGKAAADRFKALETALDCFQTEETAAWFDRWLSEVQCEKEAGVRELLETRDEVLKMLEFCYTEEKLDELRMRTDRARNVRDFILQMKEAAVSGIASYLKEKDQEETRPVRMAREYILQNYSKALTLEEVAGHAGFSAVYFSTMFKKLTGQSFADYLTEVRLAEAKKLLKEGKMSILEISEAVGYSDNKYFRKLFKKVTGMKPSDYRKLYS